MAKSSATSNKAQDVVKLYRVRYDWSAQGEVLVLATNEDEAVALVHARAGAWDDLPCENERLELHPPEMADPTSLAPDQAGRLGAVSKIVPVLKGPLTAAEWGVGETPRDGRPLTRSRP